MSAEKIDINASLDRLAEELRSRFPESAALPPGEAERRMLADGAITEAGLVEL